MLRYCCLRRFYFRFYMSMLSVNMTVMILIRLAKAYELERPVVFNKFLIKKPASSFFSRPSLACLTVYRRGQFWVLYLLFCMCRFSNELFSLDISLLRRKHTFLIKMTLMIWNISLKIISIIDTLLYRHIWL